MAWIDQLDSLTDEARRIAASWSLEAVRAYLEQAHIGLANWNEAPDDNPHTEYMRVYYRAQVTAFGERVANGDKR
jgi:hypothetical protein